jgi:hypothetical protein
MSTQPTAPTAPRRCPLCGQPYEARGPARRLDAEGVRLARYYKHTHAGRVFLHAIEHFDESSERPPIGSCLDLGLEGDAV